MCVCDVRGYVSCERVCDVRVCVMCGSVRDVRGCVCHVRKCVYVSVCV